MMTKKISPIEKRQNQNIFGILLLFVGIYFFIQGSADFLTAGILCIIGLGVSKDTRSFVLFGLKYIWAKITRQPSPQYDFSHARIVRSNVNIRTINYY